MGVPSFGGRASPVVHVIPDQNQPGNRARSSAFVIKLKCNLMIAQIIRICKTNFAKKRTNFHSFFILPKEFTQYQNFVQHEAACRAAHSATN